MCSRIVFVHATVHAFSLFFHSLLLSLSLSPSFFLDHSHPASLTPLLSLSDFPTFPSLLLSLPLFLPPLLISHTLFLSPLPLSLPLPPSLFPSLLDHTRELHLSTIWPKLTEELVTDTATHSYVTNT